MKLKISKALPPKQEQKDTICVACNGSGYYDWMDPVTKVVPECDACNGTGRRDG